MSRTRTACYTARVELPAKISHFKFALGLLAQQSTHPAERLHIALRFRFRLIVLLTRIAQDLSGVQFLRHWRPEVCSIGLLT
jgi:hypothetical protein